MEERVITATSPCLKFVDVPLHEQITKLREEVDEVYKEVCTLNGIYELNKSKTCYPLTQKSIDRVLVCLMMEMLDVQTCINTMFEQVREIEPYSFEDCKAKAEAKVIKKNMARGYYAREYENPKTD